MIIYGYNITLSDATFMLAVATSISVIFSAKVAWHTKRLADQNSKLVMKNDELIGQNERQHKERLRPLCFAMTPQDNFITDFNVILTNPVQITNLPASHPSINLRFYNKGLGPAINLRFHINDIKNFRITRDFMVAHTLPPNDKYDFKTLIPPVKITGVDGKLVFSMTPVQVVNEAYFIVCEYESMFTGDTFHSIVARGYLDHYLAGDGLNQWRFNRPTTPLVEFKAGLDPAKPIWPVPPNDVSYPGEFLNFPSTTEKEHTS